MKVKCNTQGDPVVGKEAPERTNPFAGEFSASSLNSAQCLRKYFYSKLLKVSEPSSSVALVYGSAIHEGVATYYKTKDLPLQERQQAMIQAFAENWQEREVVGDSRRNPQVGAATLYAYANFYRNEQAQINMIEIDQWIEMPNGTMILVKLDRVDEADEYTLVDTKTSSFALTDYYFKRYENDMQMLLYLHAIQEIFQSTCDNIQIDGIKVPYKGDSKSPNFVRRTFTYTELQKKECMKTYCYLTDELVRLLAQLDKEQLSDMAYAKEKKELFPCNQYRCADYGGCPYFPICRFGFEDNIVKEVFNLN